MSNPYFGNVDLEHAMKSVGPGWHHIIRRLYQNKPDGVIVQQVKEKFGTLSFYTGPAPEEYHQMIREAENESAKICETCGNPGTLTSIRGWMRTICPLCRKALDKKWAEEGR